MADYLLAHASDGTPSMIPLDTDGNLFGAIVDGVYVAIDPASLVDTECCQ